MREPYEQNLIIEPIKLKHLRMLGNSPENKSNMLLQYLLFSHWISIAEEQFKIQPGNHQAKCYVIIENNSILSYIKAKSTNSRRTCWSISYPEFLTEPVFNSRSNVYENLVKKVLEENQKYPRSWLISIPIWDNQKLSVSRELGFQPLKITKYWYFNRSTYKQYKELREDDIGKSIWQQINRQNCKLISRLEHSHESNNMRSIFDRQWEDILQQRNSYTGVLISKENNSNAIIAALINSLCPKGQNSLELIRDILWDERITQYLPKVLKSLQNIKSFYIETTSEDSKLNNFLEKQGWQIKEERVLLGKSVWRRNKKKVKLSSELDLKDIISSLGAKPEFPTLYK